MDILLTLICVIILSILYISTNNNKDKQLICALMMVLFILLFCFFQVNEDFTDYASVSYSLGKCGGFKLQNKGDITPVGGNYDNLVLGKSVKEDRPLVSDVTIFSPVGDGIKLTQDPASYIFPSVDGREDSPKHLFMLSHNQSSPECCPSTFSSSTGCVCTTKNQRDMINMRGGNRTHKTYNEI
tara:strand:- start:44 stop:595 length:552 start_codon:yes stop_codon:yes gene_type:complete